MLTTWKKKSVNTLKPLYIKVYSGETDDSSMKWKDKTIISTRKKKKLLKNKCFGDYKQGALLLILVGCVQCWKNIKAFHVGKICWKG